MIKLFITVRDSREDGTAVDLLENHQMNYIDLDYLGNDDMLAYKIKHIVEEEFNKVVPF